MVFTMRGDSKAVGVSTPLRSRPFFFIPAMLGCTLPLTQGRPTATVFEQSAFMWFLFAEALVET